MSDMNVNGSIDLLKLKNSGVLTINGKTGSKKCVVIPIEDNDIFVSTNNGNKAYLSLSIAQRKEVSKFGFTHYCKQSLGKEFKEKLSAEELEKFNNTYLGDFKTFSFEAQSKVDEIQAPPAVVAEENDDELPF